MNIDDEFEKKLKAQPLRPVPAQWRSEILHAAAEETRAFKSQPSPQPLGAREVWAWACGLFSPYAKAWAGLAAAWMVILGLHLATHDSAPYLAGGLARPSPQMREMLRQQAQLRAELLGPTERSSSTPAAGQRQSRPRSQTRLELRA